LKSSLLLIPYAKRALSNVPAREWWRSEQGKAARANGFSCTQESGDVMFVPSGWAHSVLNLRGVAGVAIEFVATHNSDAGA